MYLQFTELLETTTDFVGTAKLDGRFICHNSAAAKMLELGAAEPGVDFSLTTILSREARKVVLEEGIPTAVRDGIWMGEAAFLLDENRELPVSLILVAHRGENHSLPFFSVFARKTADEPISGSDGRV